MVNRTLNLGQLQSVFAIMLRGAGARVIRIIKQCGRSLVPWIYVENAWGQRRATFVSFRDLNRAFLQWHLTLNQMKLSFDERSALATAMYALLQVNDLVFKAGQPNLGVVASKIQNTVFVDWGDGVPMPECANLLEIF